MNQFKLNYPIAVLVAKALGWTDFIQDKEEDDLWWGTPPPNKDIPDPRPCPVPDYPTDPGEAIGALIQFRSNHDLCIQMELYRDDELNVWIYKDMDDLLEAECSMGFCSDEPAAAICNAVVDAKKRIDNPPPFYGR